jgi:hypothetical protein
MIAESNGRETLSSLRTPSHLGLIREIAANLALGVGRDAGAAICGSRRGLQGTCTCYRDPDHDGEHHCVCGRRWGESPGEERQ